MRSRLPVAARTALAMARPIGATPGSPSACRRFKRLHDVHIDFRHLINAQHLIAVEVGLLDLAVLKRNGRRGARRRAQSRCRLSISAQVTSELIGVPQSTAQTTRSTLMSPFGATVTSATCAT